MVLGTHVPPDTLCVAFGARPRSIPLNLLDGLVAARSAKAAQGLRKRSGGGPFGQPRSLTDALRTLLRYACDCILTSGSLSPP